MEDRINTTISLERDDEDWSIFVDFIVDTCERVGEHKTYGMLLVMKQFMERELDITVVGIQDLNTTLQ